MNSRLKNTKVTPEQLLGVFATVLSWSLLLAVLAFLRSFFLLIFLTFVFSYIQAHFVSVMVRKINNRRICVFFVGTCFLLVLVLIGKFLTPEVKRQAVVLADRLPSYMDILDQQVLQLSKDYAIIADALNAPNETGPLVSESKASGSVNGSPTMIIFYRLFGLDSQEHGFAINELGKLARSVGNNLLALGSAFLLSLLFSFLIVLDLPRMTAGVQSLSSTKLGFIYDEVASGIHTFGKVLGYALQAQLFVALANTLLTAPIIYLLGLSSNLAFLSVIVFFCSFIPVAGVFISSVPICVLALDSLGLGGLLLAAGLIWVVHLIEAYILNPKVFGHHMRINPVFVLIILTIAGKLFHFWGLILGVPVCTYFFRHAIQYVEPAEEL